jgi:hypothetical protein
MTATAVREKDKDKEVHLAQYATLQGSATQIASAVTVRPTGTSSNTSSMTIVTYVNEPAIEEDNYFKPHFAKHLREMLAAPLDAKAPDGEQVFIDWLNRD